MVEKIRIVAVPSTALMRVLEPRLISLETRITFGVLTGLKTKE